MNFALNGSLWAGGENGMQCVKSIVGKPAMRQDWMAVGLQREQRDGGK